MTIFKFVAWIQPSGPITIGVFVGVDEDHFQMAGRLVMEVDQWDQFKGLVADSAAVTVVENHRIPN